MQDVGGSAQRPHPVFVTPSVHNVDLQKSIPAQVCQLILHISIQDKIQRKLWEGALGVHIQVHVTQSVCKVILQKSIPAQVCQLSMHISNDNGHVRGQDVGSGAQRPHPGALMIQNGEPHNLENAHFLVMDQSFPALGQLSSARTPSRDQHIG